MTVAFIFIYTLLVYKEFEVSKEEKETESRMVVPGVCKVRELGRYWSKDQTYS